MIVRHYELAPEPFIDKLYYSVPAYCTIFKLSIVFSVLTLVNLSSLSNYMLFLSC